MLRQTVLFPAMVAMAIIGTGCGGSSAVPCATPSPGLLPFCNYPTGAQPHMIYPIPGATAVSDAFDATGIVLADRSTGNYDTPGSYYMAWFGPESMEAAFQSDTTPVILSTFYQISASQVPQPAAVSGIPSPVYEASSTPNGGIVNPIKPHTHYYVYLQRFNTDLSSNDCSAVGPVGDFTTQ